jgi:hypothetical protein
MYMPILMRIAIAVMCEDFFCELLLLTLLFLSTPAATRHSMMFVGEAGKASEFSKITSDYDV